MRKITSILAVYFLVLISSFPLLAQQAGSLDTDFGNGGIVKTHLLKSKDVCYDAVKTSESKVIAIGSTFNGTDDDIVLVRYNQDGTLDATFGNKGIVTTDIDNADNTGEHVQVAQSGNVFVTVTSRKDGVTENYLLAYDKNGNVLTSFGNNGKVKTEIEAKGLVITSENEIILAGTTSRNDSSNFTLVRYNSNGSLKTDWANNGYSNKGLGYKYETVSDILMDNNGKFVVGGNVSYPGPRSYAVARYNDDGTFDLSFGDNGKKVGRVSSGTDNLKGRSLAVDNTGEIYFTMLYGSSQISTYIINLNQNGNLDSTFSNDGILSFPWNPQSNSSNRYVDVVTDNNNKIILSGLDEVLDKYYHALELKIVRLNTDGTTDSDFIIPFTLDNYFNNTLVINQNKIVVAGNITKRGSEFRLNRFNENAELDASFGSGGQVTTAINKYEIYDSNVSGINISTNNKITIASNFDLLKYNSDGSLDYTFDTDASITKMVGGKGTFILDEDNFIVASVASVGNDRNTRTITKFKNNGIPDKFFGENGRAYSLKPMFTRYNISSSDVMKKSDGKYIIAGYLKKWGGGAMDSLLLSQYNADGTYDNEYGEVKPGILSKHSYLGMNSENKIIVSGYLRTSLTSDAEYSLTLVRLNADGSIDQSFGNNGIAESKYENSLVDNYALAIDGQDRIIVLRVVENSYSIVRFNKNGTVDENFGDNGYVNISITAKDLTVDNTGNIYVTGSYNNGGNEDIALVKYNVNGTIDNNFGNNGLVTVAIGENDDIGEAVTLDNNGKVVVGGRYYYQNNYDIVLLKFNTNETQPEKYLNVSPESRNVDAASGNTTFSVTSNISWVVNDDADWLTVTPTSGNGDATLTVTYTENTSTNSRTGMITVSGENLTESVTVVQAGKTLPPSGNDGSLDNSFGNGGIVKTKIGDKDYSFDSVIDPNGKVVSVGTTIINGNPDFVVVRYNKDGTLDNSFGENGKAVTSFGYFDDHARSVIIDNNGKIVVAGYTEVAGEVANQFDFAIARYNTDGSLDNSFGDNGKVIVSIGKDYDFGSSVVLDNNGKLIIAGLTEQSGKFDLGVIRLNQNGTLDETFGNNGITVTELNLPLKLTNNHETGSDKMAVMNVDFPWIEILPDITVDLQGRIIAAATAYVDSKLICSVSRYDGNGNIDYEFGTNGITTTSISKDADYSAEVLIDIQGKILLLANGENDCSYGFALVRYNEDGSLDNSYGINGISDFGYDCSSNTGKDAVIDSLGRVIVAVNGNAEDESVLMLYRVTKEGWTDDSFDEDGIVETLIDNTITFPESIELEPEGKIVITGIAADEDDNTEFLAVRYNATTPPLIQDTVTEVQPPNPTNGKDGDLDISYGVDGFAVKSIKKYDLCRGATIDTEGRVIISGNSNGEGNEGFPVVRFDSNGMPDNSFGDNGMVMQPDLDMAYDVAVDSKGRIIAVGKSSNENTTGFDITIVRYLTNGTLDETFGNKGIILKNITYQDAATSVAIDDNDKIVIVGYTTSNSQGIDDDIVMRFNEDGTEDQTFGTNGLVRLPANEPFTLADVVIDNFDRIIIRTRKHYLYRLKSNGNLDNSFGNNGFVNTETSVYSETYSKDLSVDLDGRIIVLSNGKDGDNYGGFLQRYTADGSLDSDFGNNGINDVTWGDHLYIGKDLVIDAKGRIIVVADYNEEGMDVSLLRYTEDGWTDDSFNEDGIVETTISATGEQPEFVGIGPNGNIFVAGTRKNADGTKDFFAAKYFGSTKIGEPGANVGEHTYLMNQNYPNPFNPTTVIRFKIPSDNNVTLKVFNMLGEEVATLVNEYKSAGLYKVTFNATGLPSGVYVYRLQAGKFTEVHKMLLLK